MVCLIPQISSKITGLEQEMKKVIPSYAMVKNRKKAGTLCWQKANLELRGRMDHTVTKLKKALSEPTPKAMTEYSTLRMLLQGSYDEGGSQHGIEDNTSENH
jgi:hypothetical protein